MFNLESLSRIFFHGFAMAALGLIASAYFTHGAIATDLLLTIARENTVLSVLFVAFGMVGTTHFLRCCFMVLFAGRIARRQRNVARRAALLAN